MAERRVQAYKTLYAGNRDPDNYYFPHFVAWYIQAAKLAPTPKQASGAYLRAALNFDTDFIHGYRHDTEGHLIPVPVDMSRPLTSITLVHRLAFEELAKEHGNPFARTDNLWATLRDKISAPEMDDLRVQVTMLKTKINAGDFENDA